MEDLLNTEVWNGKSVADYLTLDMIVSVVGSLASAIVILVIALVVSGWASRRIRTIGETHAKLDDTLFNFLSNIARYVIMAFAILFVLNTFGIQTTSMVAAIGAAGLAIGLALQGTLSNVAAGVMLILFRPIKVGDFVEINDKSGTVKDVTLNYVEMASLSNTQVIVPNSEVWGNTIVNYSVYPTRRAEWTFGVGYGVNLAKAEEVILSTIMADDRAHADDDAEHKAHHHAQHTDGQRYARAVDRSRQHIAAQGIRAQQISRFCFGVPERRQAGGEEILRKRILRGDKRRKDRGQRQKR